MARTTAKRTSVVTAPVATPIMETELRKVITLYKRRDELTDELRKVQSEIGIEETGIIARLKMKAPILGKILAAVVSSGPSRIAPSYKDGFEELCARFNLNKEAELAKLMLAAQERAKASRKEELVITDPESGYTTKK